MKDQLVRIFSEELDVDASSLSEDSSPDTVPSWDSLAAMRLVAAIEAEFDVTLTTREIMRMRTIGIAREVLVSKNVVIGA